MITFSLLHAMIIWIFLLAIRSVYFLLDLSTQYVCVYGQKTKLWHTKYVTHRKCDIFKKSDILREGFENKKVFWNGPGTISSWPPSPLGRNGPLILFFARPFFIISNAIKLKTTKVVFKLFYFLHPSLNSFLHIY